MLPYTKIELLDQETELYVELHRTKAFIVELRERISLGVSVEHVLKFQNHRLHAIREGIAVLEEELALAAD